MWGHATAFACNHVLFGDVLSRHFIVGVVYRRADVVNVVVQFVGSRCWFRSGMPMFVTGFFFLNNHF